MRPDPSIPAGLAHLAAELFGSLFVVGSSFALIASVVLIGGGTQGGAGDRLVGLAIGVVALPVFRFGRFLIAQHSVSSRRWGDEDDGGGGWQSPLSPPPSGPSALERHVAARRRPEIRPSRPSDRAPRVRPRPSNAPNPR